MGAPLVQGWCPGALRPMLSGDGYVVRVRPRSGRLTARQLAGIAHLASTCGNGLIDCSNRANIQIRGVAAESHMPLLQGLRSLGLVDDSIAAETCRNIIVTPFWETGDGTLEIANEIAARLGDLALPAKFGFAVDTGPAPLLQSVSADIRLERAADGRLLLRADGTPAGCPVEPQAAAGRAVELARWFLESGGAPSGRGRMAAHLRGGNALPAVFAPVLAPATPATAPAPGICRPGVLVGFEFGQATAIQFALLADAAPAFRATPWRMLLLEGASAIPPIAGLITNAGDPMLRVSACTGSPGCRQALAPTRSLARMLAARVPAAGHLHVSGCAKGCAHPGPAGFTLTATGAGFDLARNARAGDRPTIAGLSPADLIADAESCFGT